MPSFDVDAIRLSDLRLRQSAKYQVYDADVIPSWVAEMDFPLAEPVARALHEAVDRSDTGYRSANGLADALAEFAERRWQWIVPTSHVTPIADVLTGLAWSLRLFTEPGSKAVLNTPVYPPFFSTIQAMAERGIVDVPMARAADGSYHWDLPGLEEAFARPEVSAYVLCSPHNPTGSVPDRATLEAIHELAAEHDVLVIADEIHGPLTMPGSTHLPYLTVAPADSRAVSLVSASKAWNLPGLKCAQLVGNERTAPDIAKRMPLEVVYGSGQFGVIAAVAAYREGEPWLDDVVSIVDGNRRLLAELVDDLLPGVGYVPPDATYLAWLDFAGTGMGANPAAIFLEEARVALSPGPTYGPATGRGFARLNLGTSPAILRQTVERMAAVLR